MILDWPSSGGGEKGKSAFTLGEEEEKELLAFTKFLQGTDLLHPTGNYQL